jgi:glutathione S-transferase
MLILRSSPASPFGRKVKIAANMIGVMERIHVEPADTVDPTDSLRDQNPLGKIPVLILADGTAIYDSRVIVEYLDLLAGGGGIIPKLADHRIAALKLQALADGMMDAALLQVYEVRYRPEGERNAAWTAHQAGKVERGLAYLEAQPLATDDLTIGEISVACMLGYLDLRFGGTWREKHPRLVRFHDAFEAKFPIFAATRVTP